MAVRIELRRDAGRIDPGRNRWIRDRQVARVLGPPDPMAVAELVDHRGQVLAHGLYSPESRILLRVLSTGPKPPPADWLERRLAAAFAGREGLGFSHASNLASQVTTGYREVNSEGDGVPGLVVDRFGEWRVVQITTAPIAARRQAILAWLSEHAPLPGGQILLMADSAAAREGFAAGLEIHARDGLGTGPSALEWREHGSVFTAPFRAPSGRAEPSSSAPAVQKTGAYHDQRDNRRRFAELVAARSVDTPRVLDLGCHVGGFSIAVAAACPRARVVAVDQSATVLEHLRRNAIANQVSDQIQTVAADMFGDLARLDEPTVAGPFHAVIFDPPKIASSRRDLPRAVKAMARTLSRVLPRLANAGVIAVCSCSHHLGWDELERAVLDASGSIRMARIARWGAGFDHPIAPGHDEGQYLRVAVYQRR
ncbi:LSU m5C1962 methyltransferase RlmI [Enhygromyxa salina]|uniref:LSU m5C1962 methyltransferase RlmI n=1 Tax=Enhygromyxa salina TaxID=215803 RepID=A0A0C2D942_9BACT|nr:methyltransferase domain-containing protein [Enhygromyxa salina]KIG18125.1 LSU m5C1962 methyltransferase RlmI [Enhygromyxa salina]